MDADDSMRAQGGESPICVHLFYPRSSAFPSSSANLCASVALWFKATVSLLAVSGELLHERRCAARHAHLLHRLLDRGEGAAHLGFAEAADAADAEGVGDGELAGIDDVALVAQAIVEGVEAELRVGRHAKGDDDRRLQVVGQQRLEAERAHALDEDAAVAAVSRAAAGDAALLFVLTQCLLEGGDHLDRWGEAPLRGLLHRRPLIVQVEAQRRSVAL